MKDFFPKFAGKDGVYGIVYIPTTTTNKSKTCRMMNY